MLGMGSSTGLRCCEVSCNAPTHGSKECEAASSPPWPGSLLWPRIHHKLHLSLLRRWLPKHKGLSKEAGRDQGHTVQGLKGHEQPCWGWDKVPQGSWHVVSLGSSPADRNLDPWSPPLGEPYFWMANLWQAFDTSEKAVLYKQYPHGILRTWFANPK